MTITFTLGGFTVGGFAPSFSATLVFSEGLLSVGSSRCVSLGGLKAPEQPESSCHATLTILLSNRKAYAAQRVLPRKM